VIDSHCHLADEAFEADLPAVVERARAAGVSAALVILSAGDEAEASRARRVRELWAEVRFAVGIHPHHAGRHAADVAAGLALVRTAATDLGADAVAVGEIGLDYYYDFSPRDVQQAVFRGQLRLAAELELPVVIHMRDAADDTFAIIRREGAGVRTVFHCFTGNAETARRALDLGAWLSFAGIVTFPKAVELQDAARLVPEDRFLVETDSPYLAPVPHRHKKRNEPALVASVVDVLAELRGASAAHIAERSSENFRAVFTPPRLGNPRKNNGLAR
jgi:TatD DNase family protein